MCGRRTKKVVVLQSDDQENRQSSEAIKTPTKYM